MSGDNLGPTSNTPSTQTNLPALGAQAAGNAANTQNVEGMTTREVDNPSSNGVNKTRSMKAQVADFFKTLFSRKTQMGPTTQEIKDSFKLLMPKGDHKQLKGLSSKQLLQTDKSVSTSSNLFKALRESGSSTQRDAAKSLQTLVKSHLPRDAILGGQSFGLNQKQMTTGALRNFQPAQALGQAIAPLIEGAGSKGRMTNVDIDTHVKHILKEEKLGTSLNEDNVKKVVKNLHPKNKEDAQAIGKLLLLRESTKQLDTPLKMQLFLNSILLPSDKSSSKQPKDPEGTSNTQNNQQGGLETGEITEEQQDDEDTVFSKLTEEKPKPPSRPQKDSTSFHTFEEEQPKPPTRPPAMKTTTGETPASPTPQKAQTINVEPKKERILHESVLIEEGDTELDPEKADILHVDTKKTKGKAQMNEAAPEDIKPKEAQNKRTGTTRTAEPQPKEDTKTNSIEQKYLNLVEEVAKNRDDLKNRLEKLEKEGREHSVIAPIGKARETTNRAIGLLEKVQDKLKAASGLKGEKKREITQELNLERQAQYDSGNQALDILDQKIEPKRSPKP